MRAIGEPAFEALSARARTLSKDDLRRLSPILILSPHQDDETLGCGGLIVNAAEAGLPVRIAFLTDGGASHRGSPTWPRERLAAARRGEALDAARELGVAADDIRFLGWRDADPPPTGAACWDRTIDALRAFAGDAKSVFAPWPGEAHCDHEAAARLAEMFASLTGAALYWFVVWGWGDERIGHAAQPWRLECAATIPARRRALACHATQTTVLIADAPESFRIPPEVQALVERPAEIFLEA